MRFSNAELIAKIISGKILPGICRNNQFNQSLNTPINEQNNTPIINEQNNTQIINEQNNTQIINEQNNTQIINEKNNTQIINEANNTPVINEKNNTQIINEANNTPIINKESNTKNLLKIVHFTQNELELNNPLDRKKQSKTVRFSDNKSDIILKGKQILLGVNRCGLIGTQFNIAEELKIQTPNKLVGIIFNLQDSISKKLDYSVGNFKNNNQCLNFNCIKIIYDTVRDNKIFKNKTVTNVNLYNTNYDFTNVNAPINILPTHLSNQFESLIPITHTDVSVDNILSSETTGKTLELEHTISYSFNKDDNKVSVTVIVTNNSKNIIKNLKYYYAMNLNNMQISTEVPRIQTSPYETAVFSSSRNNSVGMYLRTRDDNSSVFIDNNWNWLYNDSWDKIKLNKFHTINKEELAISGLIFNKDVINPNTSWLINFSLGFTNEYDFLSSTFVNSPTGLNLKHKSFENMKMNNIITSCADFTGCNLSGVDLLNNNLCGAKTGPLAKNSYSPKSLPKGYHFVISKNKNQDRFIVGPNVDLSNCELIGIDFLDINLTGANLSRTNLSGSNLSNSTLNQVKFSQHNSHDESLLLPPAYVVKHNFILGSNLDYSNNDFSNVDLSNLLLTGCNFTNCNFSNTNLSNTNLTNCNFTNITPGPIKNNFIISTVLPYEYAFVILDKDNVCIAGPKVNFSNMNLTNSKFHSINLSEANFTNSLLSGVIMSEVELTNAITGPILLDINKTIILPPNYFLISSETSNEKYIVGPNIRLIDKNLSNFNLSNVDLSGSTLVFSNLTGTNLSQTNLKNTYLPTVIGPLKQNSTKPINYENTMSFESLGKENWLIYNWNDYKWDSYLSQLYKSITNDL